MTKPAIVTAVATTPSTGWWGRAGVLLFVAALFLPGILLAHDRYWLPLFSRYLALALFAMSVDLVWGYTGLLSLGQGLYFALGAYAVGYSLKLQRAALEAGKPLVAAPDMARPDFMIYCGKPDAVPFWLAPLINIWVALALAIVLPALVGMVFGLFTFRRRIRGVFFALVTQALVLAMYTLVVNQQPYTGGIVGMTRLARLEIFGHQFMDLGMFFLIATVLTLSFLACLALVRGKFGRILTAIRDNEYRVLALGYNTAMYKTFVYALAGALAGLAGALYVSALHTTGPEHLGIAFSIEVVVLVAVGGRGTLFGAILGAVLVNLTDTYTSSRYASAWPFILGGLFIGVVLFLPDGLVGGVTRLARWLQRTWAARRAVEPPTLEPAPAAPAALRGPQPILGEVGGP